jgi:glucose dehydrogenase
MAIDPQRGMIVANDNDIPNDDHMVPRIQARKAGWRPRPETTGFSWLDTPYGCAINAGWRVAFTTMPCREPPYGGIQAVDLKTGKTLWTAKLPADGHATPIVCSVDGREYVAIMAAGHHFVETPERDFLVAYTMPK